MERNEYRCRHCGYIGPCYGTPFIGGKSGVSAPWCKQCGKNDGLEEKPKCKVIKLPTREEWIIKKARKKSLERILKYAESLNW